MSVAGVMEHALRPLLPCKTNRISILPTLTRNLHCHNSRSQQPSAPTCISGGGSTLPPRICAGVAPPYAAVLRAASTEMLPPARREEGSLRCCELGGDTMPFCNAMHDTTSQAAPDMTSPAGSLGE